MPITGLPSVESAIPAIRRDLRVFLDTTGLPDDEAQVRVRVERAGHREAQHVHPGLGVPAPARRRQRGARALGQAASGHIDVEEDHVRLEVTLPWLLQRFAEAARSAIQKRGNLLLTKR